MPALAAPRHQEAKAFGNPKHLPDACFAARAAASCCCKNPDAIAHGGIFIPAAMRWCSMAAVTVCYLYSVYARRGRRNRWNASIKRSESSTTPRHIGDQRVLEEQTGTFSNGARSVQPRAWHFQQTVTIAVDLFLPSVPDLTDKRLPRCVARHLNDPSAAVVFPFAKVEEAISGVSTRTNADVTLLLVWICFCLFYVLSNVKPVFYLYEVESNEGDILLNK